MFDVGFSELVVIAVVALIVVGPERLRKVARTAGHLLGRLQRYVNDVKADITREMQLEEMKKLQAQINEQAKALEASVTQQVQEAETTLHELAATPAAAAAGDAAGTQPAQAPLPAAETATVPVQAAARSSEPPRA